MLTQIDAQCALVVIDLQKGIVGRETVHPTAKIVERAAALAKAFRKRGAPVVLVNVAGRAPGRTDAGAPNIAFSNDWVELAPGLDVQESDHLVTKHRFGAFIGTDLQQYLQVKRVTQIFLAGISTSIGVESTARSAYDFGYNVVIISDAVTDMSAEAHQNSMERIFPRMAEIATTEEALKKLST